MRCQMSRMKNKDKLFVNRAKMKDKGRQKARLSGVFDGQKPDKQTKWFIKTAALLKSVIHL